MAPNNIKEILMFIDEVELPELNFAVPALGNAKAFKLPTNNKEQGFVNAASVQSFTVSLSLQVRATCFRMTCMLVWTSCSV